MEKQHFRKYQNDDTRIIDLNCKDFRVFMDEIMKGKFDEFAKTLAPLPSTEGDLLSRKQAADLLKITLPTLRDWTKSGKLKSCKIEGSSRVYYRADKIYLALHEQPAVVRK